MGSSPSYLQLLLHLKHFKELRLLFLGGLYSTHNVSMNNVILGTRLLPLAIGALLNNNYTLFIQCRWLNAVVAVILIVTFVCFDPTILINYITIHIINCSSLSGRRISLVYHNYFLM